MRTVSLLAKIDPAKNPPIMNGNVQIHAPGFKGSQPEVGDEVFVWTSQDQGGVGLCGLGIVAEVAIDEFKNVSNENTHSEFVATLTLLSDSPNAVLAKTELEPYRNVDDGSAIYEIAHLAYFHSHNKFSDISYEAARFLRAHFV